MHYASNATAIPAPAMEADTVLHDPIPSGSRARTHAGFLHDGAVHTFADSQREMAEYRRQHGLGDGDAPEQAAAHFALATYLPPRAVRS